MATLPGRPSLKDKHDNFNTTHTVRRQGFRNTSKKFIVKGDLFLHILTRSQAVGSDITRFAMTNCDTF